MTTPMQETAIDPAALARIADEAGRMIPPVWPLAAMVAVNPFLGQAGETLAETAARLARVGGVPVTMPRAWYRERIADGRIAETDLAAALAACPHGAKPGSVEVLREAAEADRPAPEALPTMAHLAAQANGTDWPGLVADRIGVWAQGHFDKGQALWQAPHHLDAWTAWRQYATHDLTPEIMGLEGFAAFVAALPDQPEAAIARGVAALGLDEAALATYFHALLLDLGGWAQLARHDLWQAELAGGTDRQLLELLAIRLAFEEALLRAKGEAVAEPWAGVRAAHAEPLAPSADDIVDAILQDAADRAGQRGLGETLAEPAPEAPDDRPALQAAFCIDVRSEVFRRALESVDPSIRTLGFAGFFGVFTKHRRFASDIVEPRLPVLVNANAEAVAGGEDDATAAKDRAARYAARAKRAWGRFKFAAVSSFAFVEAMGPVYVGKLVRDALGMDAPKAPNDPAPRFEPALDADTRIASAETILRAMSLTEGFARVVLLAGHGAGVTNNPHASALQCGACGGYSGEVNARLLAGLLNDAAVREGLVARGIEIPGDTLFVAGLHDTTTDAVTLYDADTPAPGHKDDLARVRRWLAEAGSLTRAERAASLPGATHAGAVEKRARDWAEVRPEWALARCKAFVAAPRSRTAGRSLEGRAFLHDYDWKADGANGYGVLELIMTAPVVVASWISLQYYGSTVAPDTFGSGNKLLHNIVGGVGVVEGNGGRLRAGLPWQSVHDGEALLHEPVRLSVCIEAPAEAMTDILSRHEGVRALFDNGWLHLFRIGADGRLVERYAGGLAWEPCAEDGRPAEIREVA